MIEQCGLINCKKPMGPGSAAVGFENEGRIDEVRVCPQHAWLLMTAPRGTYFISPEKELKLIPAKPLIL